MEITFDKRNYRKHNAKNKKIIRKSLEELGAGRSVVVDKENCLVAGNGVYEQAQALKMPVRVVETDGSELVVVKRTDLATGDERRRKLALADNSASDTSEWNEELLCEDWSAELLKDWGVEFEELKISADEIATKEAEFKERMAAGEISEEDEEYQAFLEKFKLKKTTDDCYTPAVVYDAVADYVARTYGVKREKFIRPFYPGGDYKREKYPKGCVVVDNPPFSILAEILKFYNERGVAFFLFAPTLTLFSPSSSSYYCALPCGVVVTYENGANVTTSFITSFESETIRVKSVPELYKIVKEANDANLANMRRTLPRNEYPLEIVTAPRVGIYSRLGVEFVVPKAESLVVSRLDAQKDEGNSAIFGKGYIVSERIRAERIRAERERAERERAEREIAERERVERERAERERAERERAKVWLLSEREKEIVKSLNPKDYAERT